MTLFHVRYQFADILTGLCSYDTYYRNEQKALEKYNELLKEEKEEGLTSINDNGNYEIETSNLKAYKEHYIYERGNQTGKFTQITFEQIQTED